MAYLCRANIIGGQDGKIVLEVVDASSGDAYMAIGRLEIAIADLAGQELKARWTQGCDPETGDPKYALMIRGAWITEEELPEGADLS